jgi:hypothetical protein
MSEIFTLNCISLEVVFQTIILSNNLPISSHIFQKMSDNINVSDIALIQTLMYQHVYQIVPGQRTKGKRIELIIQILHVYTHLSQMEKFKILSIKKLTPKMKKEL